ncbi:hemin receptor [Gluconobacter oxydans]|uniref:heme/hemin ABC transporter substrate-binding protein n=1 Tax=Gluconobacter thailandicus TaxID=257438 RepID=UPI0002999F0D|nr:ABC transporter substrate-binding protein [Gluconobacter thailandicus]AFW02973.1 periplasmic binding protein [Gluconobacter oxydans H24]ANQ41623.1 hemin receptor [Gluconobacter oxydans]GAN89944.1 Hemin-binding periplasmic protein HmuT [Gluconobacter frateurii M-2]
MMHSLSLDRRGFVALFVGGALFPTVMQAQTSLITDCRGRSVSVGSASRIACIGGTITETLYRLGVANKIVAVDTTSTWPEEALKDKKSVGYMRAISSEGVLSVRPDLILAMNASGPADAMDQLVASGIPIVFVDSTSSPDAILERTRFLARAVGREEAGEEMCRDIQSHFNALKQWRAGHSGTPRVLFVMRMTNNRPLVAGQGTAADAVIRLAGGINVGADLQGYKLLNTESLVTLRPDIILTMSQGGAEIRQALLSDPGFSMTPAGRKKAIVEMEGERLLGFGPRTPEAALDLAHMMANAGKPV